MPATPRQEYNTDLTCKQWNEMKKIIPPSKRITKRTLDQREIINAVLYLVHIGCLWRNLPHDFPHWKSVYNVWYQCRNDGTWQRIHNYWDHKIQKSVGKKQKPSVCIIESQSVKDDANVSESTGYDAADIQNQKGAKGVLQGIKKENRRLKVVFADSAYKRSKLPDWVRGKGFIVLPNRWIVERTHAWVSNSRRHSKDYEHQTKSSETMIKYCHSNNL